MLFRLFPALTNNNLTSSSSLSFLLFSLLLIGSILFVSGVILSSIGSRQFPVLIRYCIDTYRGRGKNMFPRRITPVPYFGNIEILHWTFDGVSWKVDIPQWATQRRILLPWPQQVRHRQQGSPYSGQLQASCSTQRCSLRIRRGYYFLSIGCALYWAVTTPVESRHVWLEFPYNYYVYEVIKEFPIFLSPITPVAWRTWNWNTIR